ncbi:MAG: TIGR02757 family protein [Acidobacteriota bacterium]
MSLRIELDRLVRTRGLDFLNTDPLQFARRFSSRSDRECAALISAVFAYGNVRSIFGFLERLFAGLGPHPARSIQRGAIPATLPGYRFQTSADVRAFLESLGKVLRESGSFEACFSALPGAPEDRLEAFAWKLRRESGGNSAGLRHLLPLPSGGSACKRWRLFLRWVVRPDDGLDLGLWSTLSPRQLLMPIDTHLARISYALRLTDRKTADRQFALEVTRALARFCPEDPLRYDFALARLGILRECPSRRVDAICRRCPLQPHCRLSPGTQTSTAHHATASRPGSLDKRG